MAVTKQQREHLRELIKGIDIAMFTTIGERGFPVSRPLSTQQAEFDGKQLWFFVRGNSPKAGEIARNPKVNVAYASKDRNAYLSVAGHADLVRNRAKIRALWNDVLKVWFRQGLDDPELALIRVRVHTIEFWEGPSSAVGKLVGFVTAAITGRDDAMGENRMVRVRKSPAKRAARKPIRKVSAKRVVKKAPATKKAARRR